MTESNVIKLRKPAEKVEDALSTVLRQGAQELLSKGGPGPETQRGINRMPLVLQNPQKCTI